MKYSIKQTETKDRFVWGVTIGVIANVPKEMVDFSIYFLLRSKFYCWMIPAGLTLSPKWNTTLWGILVGGINDFLIAGMLGAGLTYFLAIMEKRFLFFKGMCYSLGVWLFVCMIIATRVSYWLRMQDPGFYFQNFAVHQIWGIVATWLNVKYLFKEEKFRS